MEHCNQAPMALFYHLLFILSIFAKFVVPFSWTATPFNPAAFPLAVRSPYLSAWLPQGSGMHCFAYLDALAVSDQQLPTGAALNDIWPTFWTGQVSEIVWMMDKQRSDFNSRLSAGLDLSRSMANLLAFSVHPTFLEHHSPKRCKRVLWFVASLVVKIGITHE